MSIFIGMNCVVGWPADWPIAQRSWPQATPGAMFRARITRRHVLTTKLQIGFEYVKEGDPDRSIRYEEHEIWWSDREQVTRSGQQIWRKCLPLKLEKPLIRKLP